MGRWKIAALDLTRDILQQVSGYGRDVANEKENALGPLRRTIGKVASLNEAKGAPEEGGLRDLGRKLGMTPVTGGRGREASGPLPTRPVMGSLYTPGNEITDLVRCLARAQANDGRLPVFNGKYVEYPQFRKEWWAYW
jgi:hypothetical protein